MAAPEVTLVDPKRFRYDETIEVAAGESQIIVKLPANVPAGKKAVVRLRVSAQLVNV